VATESLYQWGSSALRRPRLRMVEPSSSRPLLPVSCPNELMCRGSGGRPCAAGISRRTPFRGYLRPEFANAHDAAVDSSPGSTPCRRRHLRGRRWPVGPSANPDPYGFGATRSASGSNVMAARADRDRTPSLR
jgi:hypothetical protein